MKKIKLKTVCAVLITLFIAVSLLYALGIGAYAADAGGYTWVYQNPLQNSMTLYSTSAASRTRVWSVGEYGAIGYWNGTTLTKQASGTTNNLYDVDARDTTHIWAVGEAGTILFCNGTTWTRQTAPTLPYSYDLLAVSAADTTHIWAVGGHDGFNNAVILFSNGTTWTVQQTMATGGFTDVYAYNTTNVWAVSGWTWRYNGATWSQVNDGSAHDPYQVSAYSTTNLWAVDWDGTILNSTNGGVTWNAALSGLDWPATICAFNATNIWVVGWEGNTAFYNGTTWSYGTMGITDVCGVDAFATNSVFACGDAMFWTSTGALNWTTRTGGTTSQLNAVDGLDANNVWTAGTNVATYGNIQSTTTGGNIWNTQSSSTTNTLYGVADFDATHVWVGAQNFLNFWNGGAWTTQINGTANTVSPTTITVGTQPRSAAVNAVTNKIYVANAATNNVSVIDGGTDTNIKTIGVGTNPRGVCVNSTTNRVYVANNTSNNVTVIDGSTDTFIKNITVGTTPYRLSVNPVTNKIYVANYGSSNVTVIDGATDTTATIGGIGTGPIATGVNPVTNKIYVANYGSNNVSVINGATDTVTRTTGVGSQPYDVGVNTSTNKIYVPNNNAASVSIINGATDLVSSTLTTGIGTNPRGVCVNSTTNRIYVANFTSNTVSVVDGSTDTVTTTVTVGTGPFGIGVNPSTTKIYVSNYTTNNVSVINGKDRAFYCVTAAAANRVWSGADDGWIQYYDGTTWSIQNPDSQYSTGYYGISAADTTDVWAVGASGEIVYWNGTSWAKQASNTTNTLRAVTAINASTAWAVGDGGVIRYTNDAGSTWQTQTSGTTQNLLGVSAADATHVWAVGAGGTVLFYNGTSWTAQTSPTTNNLRAVFAWDANDAWAVGDNGTIIFADPPYIKAVGHGWGDPGDTVDVEVIGAYTNFRASAPDLTFGDGVSVVSGSVNVVDNTHILAQVQIDVGAALGPRDVNATTVSETPIPLKGGFVVGASPTIASVSPTSAIRGWTGDVEIKGSQTDFSPSSQATFGSGINVNSLSYQAVDEVTANITVEASAAPGPRSVNVTTGGETPAPLVDGFTVVTPPSIMDVSPGQGSTGAQVTIAGNQFGGDRWAGWNKGFSQVEFNGVPATEYTSWSGSQIEVLVPGGAISGQITVNTADGTSNPVGFTVNNPTPTITSLSPDHITAGSPGFTLTVNGTNFVNGSVVKWNGSNRATTHVSPTKLTASIPASDVASAGTTKVTVFNPAPGGGTSETKGFAINNPTPTISSLSLGNEIAGSSGFTLTVTGTNFVNGSVVKWNGSNKATAYVSPTKLTASIPASDVASAGTAKVTAFNPAPGGGTSNTKTFTITGNPNGSSSTWYLAEGSTAHGFDCDIAVMNPNDKAVTIRPTFMTTGGAVTKPNIALPAYSSKVINPRRDYGLVSDFSTKIECLEKRPIAVDRTMYWAGEEANAGVSGGGGAGEGHSSIGVTSPANTWYLAEGSSAWGFECWLLIQNPGSGEAHCQVTYMIEGAQPVTVTKVIPPGTRRSFNMADDIGTADASIKVASDVPVVPERSMYRDNRREGSNSIGTTAPAEDYYLSEGTTAWGFTTYVLVQNPNPVPADVTVTYMTPSGSFATAPRTIPAGSRMTIKVNDEAPNTDLSVKVHGSQPIIAERAMYWDGAGGEACHDSIGLDAPHRVFLLPGGLAGQFGQQWFETWTLVQNPNDVDVKVRVSYLTDGAKSNTSFDAVVRANSRMSFNMGDKLAAGRAGVLVECLTPGRKIMAERSTYWNGRGSGVCTIGGFSD